MRNENGVSEELAQGVERLDLLYAVTDRSGNVSYLTAAQIGAAGAQCPPPSADLYTPGSVPVLAYWEETREPLYLFGRRSEWIWEVR